MDRLLLVYVADWHRKRRKVHSFKRLCSVQNFLREWNHSVWILDRLSAWNTYSISTERMHSIFLPTAEFFMFCILFASASAVRPSLSTYLGHILLLTKESFKIYTLKGAGGYLYFSGLSNGARMFENSAKKPREVVIEACGSFRELFPLDNLRLKK